jgi:hypothetical protein
LGIVEEDIDSFLDDDVVVVDEEVLPLVFL